MQKIVVISDKPLGSEDRLVRICVTPIYGELTKRLPSGDMILSKILEGKVEHYGAFDVRSQPTPIKDSKGYRTGYLVDSFDPRLDELVSKYVETDRAKEFYELKDTSEFEIVG